MSLEGRGNSTYHEPPEDEFSGLGALFHPSWRLAERLVRTHHDGGEAAADPPEIGSEGHIIAPSVEALRSMNPHVYLGGSKNESQYNWRI